MKKKTFLIYSLYIFLKTTWGLIATPYQTLWQVRRRPVLFPVIFMPILNLFVLFLCGKIAALILSIYGTERVLVAIILSTIFLSLLLWQALLIYFLVTFLLVQDTSQK